MSERSDLPSDVEPSSCTCDHEIGFLDDDPDCPYHRPAPAGEPSSAEPASGITQEAVNFGAIVAAAAAHCEWCEARMVCPNGCADDGTPSAGEPSRVVEAARSIAAVLRSRYGTHFDSDDIRMIDAHFHAVAPLEPNALAASDGVNREVLRETLQRVVEIVTPRSKLWGYCGTPLCDGWSAEVQWNGDALIVQFSCPCGSEDGWEPLGDFLTAGVAALSESPEAEQKAKQ